jgi:flagellar M-ring protein FliF
MNQQLTQVFKQLQTIWSQLGLNQKITLVATTLALFVGLGSLMFWTSRPSYSLLYGRLDEAEAAKVVAALEEAGIPYEVGRGNGGIMVPSDKVHSTRMQLAAKGMPRGEGIGFEIFDRSNFGISDFVQRANYLRAVQGELARTISQVESVETARVMIVMPENRLLVNDKNRPTASVFVKVRGNVPLPGQTVTAIRFLVANAVEGLQPNHVSVVDNSGNVLSDTMEPDSTVGLTQTQLEVRKKFEQYLARKAEGMLEAVLGPGQAVVRVSAEMNFDTTTRVEEKFDPDSVVARSTTENEETTDSLSAVPAVSSPGMDANMAGDTNTMSAAPQNNNRTRKKVKTHQYEVNKTTSNVVQAGGGVRQLSAAVFLASRMQGTGTNRVALPRTPEELEKLKKIVQSALGILEGNERSDQISLEEMPFNDNGAVDLAHSLQKEQNLQFGLQLVQTLAYPVAGLIVFGMLWRTFKRAPDVDIPVGVPVGQPGEEATATANGKGDGRNTPGVITVDVLNQLIRENPQNMTHAIRGWMTRGQSK